MADKLGGVLKHLIDVIPINGHKVSFMENIMVIIKIHPYVDSWF